MRIAILSGLWALTNAQFLFNPHPDTGFEPHGDMPCTPDENKPDGLNYYGCNDAGTCVWNKDEFGNEFVGEASRCDCCDKHNRNSWCYGGLENGNEYTGYRLEGDQCARMSPQQGVIFGFRFETAGGLNPPLTCSDTDDPDPANQLDCTGDQIFKCLPNRDLSDQLELALKYPCKHDADGGNRDCSDVTDFTPTYKGVVGALGCQTCTPKYPCTRTGPSPVTSGVVLAFVSYFNTYYDPACVQEPGTPPQFCGANQDYGWEASNGWQNARGADFSHGGETDYGLLIGDSFVSVLEGTHPKCGTADDAKGACAAVDAINFSCDPDRGCPNRATFYEKYIDTVATALVQATDMPTQKPTPTPVVPTPEPTADPTPADPCWPYINLVLDHKFIGAGEHCRAGIEQWWPDGITCKSPYVVCLPDENTPMNPDPLKLPNIGQALPAADYSIMECAEECAFDQRCSGFELQPAAGTGRGKCLLIDDVDIIVENKSTWPIVGTRIGSVDVLSDAHVKAGLPEVGPEMEGPCCGAGNGLLNLQAGVTLAQCQDACFADTECNAFSYGIFTCTTCEKCTLPPKSTPDPTKSYTVTGRLEMGGAGWHDSFAGDSLCFAKMEYCNPYFEASDLNEVMLKCYCPNNRKGTYTKKVKRTVPNTKFCEEGFPEIEERIKKAQANRMFHLCENWCLFETSKPKTESWYWNPWKTCWREQYAGTGVHMSYCNRVIRNPDTIEQHFIEKRSDNFCVKDRITADILHEVTETPTGQPSVFSSTWFLAEEEDNCNETCEDQSMMCDEAKTNSLVTGMETEMNDALEEATSSAQSCSSYKTGNKDWALPGIKTIGPDAGMCELRDPSTEYIGCNWAIGVGYQRLCACYSP